MDDISRLQNPQFAAVELARPENLTPSQRPTISLHLLVKNGDSCVGRLIDNVGPQIHEVVAVVNDTTDDTIGVLKRKTADHALSLKIIEVTAASHPEFYIMDSAETYREGVALGDEVYEGPFTNKPLLADWAAVRNLGWNQCSMKWRLFLDADDVVLDPECLPGLCLLLEERGVDMAATRYLYNMDPEGNSRSDSFRERLSLNLPRIQWTGITHEGLRGQKQTAHIDGNLIVRDMRDSTGTGLRSPGRCFKILYHHARTNHWMVSPRTLIYMAMEIRATMPDLASAIIDSYLRKSTWPEERAWACCMRGEICEKVEDWKEASEWYERALVEHPGSKAAFRLCHSRFRMGAWQAAVDAHQLGVENKAVLQVLDNGPAFENGSKILVAAALRKLGRSSEALTKCREAMLAFPHNAALKELSEGLEKDLAG